MTKRLPMFVFGIAALAFAAVPARAQWTSSYEYVTVAATFNGYDTYNPNMQLISNGVWQGYFNFSANSQNLELLFATRDFGKAWKEDNQNDFVVPIALTAETPGSRDIVVSNIVNATLRIIFNENTRQYWIDDVTPGSAYVDLWINEFHYDNTGNDVGEFVEVAGLAGVNLSGYKLALYRGVGTVYNTINLSGTIPNQVGGYGTVAHFLPVNGLQNGAPSGIALYKGTSNVLHFISYNSGSLTAADGPANGMTAIPVGVAEGSASSIGYSLQLTGSGAAYPAFTWSGPETNSAGQMNAGQAILVGTPAATITFSNLTVSPTLIGSTNSVHISVNATTANSPTDVRLYTFYRANQIGRFLPIAMSVVSGNLYRTSTAIPPQVGGATVEYYIFASFKGGGTNSPVFYPDGAPDAPSSYYVSAVNPGYVWINEVFPGSLFFEPEGTEFIEITGRAGSDISGWKLEVYNNPAGLPTYSYTIPPNSVLGNEQDGYGFYVIGSSNTPNVQIAWATGLDVLPDLNGGARLLNEFGGVVGSVHWWSESVNDPGLWPGFVNIWEYDDFFGESGPAAHGTGSTFDDFSWWPDASITPGSVNGGQTLTGGDTNVLPPLLKCPSNIFLSCLTDTIPSPATNEVQASSLCGGAVSVTWVGDSTNAGSGCLGNPKIITRTWRAVASSCSLTSTCTQLIVIEDKTPPLLLCDTTGLENPGFEVGDFTGWTTYGGAASNISVVSMQAHSGFRHARLRGSSTSMMLDSSSSEAHGFYIGNPLRQQTGATTNTGKSIRFNGTNQYAEVPPSPLFNNTSFSFAFWVKPLQSNSATRALVSSRQFTISELSGYHVQLSTSNTLQFWTADGPGWDILSGPSLNTNWSYIAGSYSYATGLKRLWVNGVETSNRYTSASNFVANTTRPLRIAAGATESEAADFFGGFMDDVRLFDWALDQNDINDLYNSGTGLPYDFGAETAYYRLDESTVGGVSTSGFHQVVSAQTGQTWTAASWVMIPNEEPLRGGNQVYVKLDYLNATNGVLASYTSQVLTATSPTGAYFRVFARGPAPLNTAFARLATVFQQDASGSDGSVYFDDTVLSTLVLVNTNNTCPTMPDLRYLVSATDGCSTNITITQYPGIGDLLSATNAFVRFTATDACGLSAYCERALTVLDDTLPTIECPDPIAVSCISEIPAPDPASVIALDNCGPAMVSFVRDDYSSGTGCAAEPIYVYREYQATDLSGNSTSCIQVITVADTNGPVFDCSPAGVLVNADFEYGSELLGWQRGGTASSVTTTSRPGGIYSVQMGSPSSASVYQGLSAQEGQHWRGSAWVLQRSAFPIGNGRLELRLFFIDGSGVTLQTLLSRSFTRTDPTNVFVSLYVQGVAPSGTRSVRIAPSYVQVSGPAQVFVDDVSLDMTTFTATNGTFVLPDLSSMAESAQTCSESQFTQVPAPGTTLNLGTTPVEITAVNQCGMTSVCTTVVTVLDESGEDPLPPEPTNVEVVGVSMTATGMTVRSLGTNTWSVHAEYTTNLMGNPQNWIVVPTSSNSFLNGTNITTFQPPVTGNTPVIYRIWQKYP